MAPKVRKSFDDEPGPRKTPLEGVPVPPAASGAGNPSGAGEPGAAPPAAGVQPAANAPPLKRITNLIYKPKPVETAAPTGSTGLLEQLAAQKAANPHPAPAEPEKPEFQRGPVANVNFGTLALPDPRSTTITTTVDAELGATFISGRIKLQVLHFPQPQGKRRVMILNDLPDTQSNVDLAQALWLAGDEVIVLHPRGVAGSDGHFSLKTMEKDVRQAMQPTVETGHRDRLWSSVGPVLLIASGLSAPPALAIASEDERLAGVVLIDPLVEIPLVLNIDASPVKPQDLYNHMVSGVASMVGREILNEEWDYLAQMRNPMEMAQKGSLDHMPILHITSDRSLLAPMGKRFSAAIHQYPAKLYQHVHLPGTAPHFWRHRHELIDAVAFWISQQP